MANIVTTTQWGTLTISNADALNNTSQIFINTFNIPAPNTPNLSPSSPTGAFIQELTDMQINTSSTLAYVTSNLYSLVSTNGIFLDGIGGLFGILRGQSKYTTVACTLTGTPSTVIPSGSEVSDGTNNYILTSPATIGSLGNVIATFTCTVIGAIIASPYTITTIVTPIAGWSSVNNSTAGITGQNIQNDTAYRYTLQYGQALNSRGMIDSLYATFLNFMAQNGSTTVTYNNVVYPYVQGFYTFVNTTNAPVTLSAGSTPVPVGGVYVSVYAPQFLDSTSPNYATNQQYIAGLILNQIGANQTLNIVTPTGGALNFAVNYNNTVYTAVDPVTIYFDSPAPTPIQFNFTVKIYNTTLAPSTIILNIQNAILTQFYFGYQGYDPAQMNVAINTVDYILAIVNAVGSSCTVTAQNVQLVTGGSPATTLTLPLYQVATLNGANIIITLA